LAHLLRRYPLPLWRERDPGSDVGSTATDAGNVAQLGAAHAPAPPQETTALDLYQTLGISSEASPLEIKVAFRKLAKALHPDLNAGDRVAESHFAAVHEAYTILSNAEWRAIYDQELERIRLAVQAQLAEQRSLETRRFWRTAAREAAKTAVATVVLTAVFITGISLWQRNSSGLQRNHPAGSGVGPTLAYVPPTLSREELAEALFGGQSGRYVNEVATPSNEAIAMNSQPSLPSHEAIAASSEPSPPSHQAIAASSEPSLPSHQAIATSNAPSLPSEAVASNNVTSAAIEPPSAPPAASVDLASVGKPHPLANEPAALPSKTLDQVTRAQAERLIGLGEHHLANGNVAIARQYFTRAVDLGFAPAAIMLAETFEAQVLARHGVHGVRPDPAEAEKWRKRASELGK